MKILKNNLLVIFFLLTAMGQGYSQVIQTEPAFPVVSDSVIIYYDATEGTGGLEDFTGDVYAHTGVITENSTSESDWRYVVADWGENIPKIALERVETNLYKLNIQPSIRDYYGVPQDEKIEQMAFVFRNSNGSLEGKAEGGEDIYVDVYQSAFNVRFLQPEDDPYIQQDQEAMTIMGIGSSDSPDTELALSIDGSEVERVNNDTLVYSFEPPQRKHYQIALTGTDGMGNDTATQTWIVNPEVIQQDRPQGLKDGITYVDDQTVRLSLFAPYKDYIYLIGDFNDWQIEPEYFMRRDSVNQDSVYYWIELPGLNPGEEYAFQYLIDGNIRVTDPYVHKILDGANDTYITDDTYPDLKPYPTGKTEQIAGVLQPGRDDYNWQTQDYQRPDPDKLVIYELLIRDFVAQHDYQTLIDTLDYLDRLGVNAIELMPVTEFDANISWGYNPTFHLAVDKYYGPARDLKAFIDSCHSRDMAVILDMVLNHAWGPSPLVRLWNEGDFGNPTPENPYLNVEARHDFNVGYDFNHENAATQYFVDRVNQYWLEEFRFDGFRYDLSKGFTQENTLGNPGEWGQYDASRVRLLKRMADTLWQADSRAYVILEHFAANQEEQELANYGMMIWGNMNHNYNEATMGYHSQGKSDFSGISYLERGWNEPHLVGYMESHDEQRLMYKNLEFGNSSGSYDTRELETALDRLELAATFFLPVPGPKMIWQFGELGYDVSIDYDCRTCPKPIKWEYYQDQDRRDLYQVYSMLNELRHQYEVFHTSDFSLSVGDPIKRITLRHESADVVLMGNFGLDQGSIDPHFTQEGYWYEIFTQDSLEVQDVNSEIALEAGEYRMYATQKMLWEGADTSDSDTTTFISPSPGTDGVRVFPNPSRGAVRFSFESQGSRRAKLNIYGPTGRKVASLEKKNLHSGINTIRWIRPDQKAANPQLYIYELQLGGERKTGKFLKY